MIGKRLDSRYVAGRGSAWIKVKNWGRQEAVIGGWTTGKGGRTGSLGALLLGIHDGDGALHYIGRVGTGFDARELERLGGLLEPLARKSTPFTGRQPPKGSHFVEPELVCEVEFSEWTHAGTLRQPSYKGLRDDKRAEDVVRERVGACFLGRRRPLARRRLRRPRWTSPTSTAEASTCRRCSPTAARYATAWRSRSTAGS